MADRVQKPRPATEQSVPEADAVDVATSDSSKQSEKLKAELDDLLDEIDDVLESNAEDFVKSYIQKGGE